MSKDDSDDELPRRAKVHSIVFDELNVPEHVNKSFGDLNKVKMHYLSMDAGKNKLR